MWISQTAYLLGRVPIGTEREGDPTVGEAARYIGLGHP